MKNIKKIYFNYADMNSVDGGEAGIGYGSLYLRNKSVSTDERKLLITLHEFVAYSRHGLQLCTRNEKWRYTL